MRRQELRPLRFLNRKAREWRKRSPLPHTSTKSNVNYSDEVGKGESPRYGICHIFAWKPEWVSLHRFNAFCIPQKRTPHLMQKSPLTDQQPGTKIGYPSSARYWMNGRPIPQWTNLTTAPCHRCAQPATLAFRTRAWKWHLLVAPMCRIRHATRTASPPPGYHAP